MRDLLDECRKAFGTAPREFALWDRLAYFRVAQPAWVHGNPPDDLCLLFDNLELLFSRGIVVWGHVVQANQLLFGSGHHNCPGEVVYSLDDARIEPEDLEQIASRLFALKGTEPQDRESRRIADYLTDECQRVFGLSVPGMLSYPFRCEISTTFFARHHLPGRRLCHPLLPLVVSPHQPRLAMPLPAKYWPSELVAWWVESDDLLTPPSLQQSGGFDRAELPAAESSAWLRQTKRLFPHPVFAAAISFACLLVGSLLALVTMNQRVWPLAAASVLFFAGAYATGAAAISLWRSRDRHGTAGARQAGTAHRTFAVLVLLVAVYSWLLTIALHVFSAFFKNGPGSMKYFVTLGIAVAASVFMQVKGKRVIRDAFGRQGGRNVQLTGRQSLYVVLFVLGCSFYLVWLTV